MKIDVIRDYCPAKLGVTEGMKWGEHLTFMVDGKMFAVFGMDQVPINASFKVSDEDFEIMSELEGMEPAPYFAENIRIAVDDISRISEKEWKRIFDQRVRVGKGEVAKESLGYFGMRSSVHSV